MIENMVITDEYKTAMNVIENDKNFKILFITGKAGTGKSVFLEYLRSRVKNTAVVAPTGIAAMNVNGVTIHSFFKFGIGFMDRNKVKKAKDPSVYCKLDYLIIDEISMVRADMFDCINKSLQRNRDATDQAFGGVKIIIFGDLCQLPPIVQGSEKVIMEHAKYDSPYFFGSKIFQALRSSFRYIEFTHIFRQSDPKFKALLQAVRTNTPTNEDYKELKSRVMPLSALKKLTDDSMILCTTNAGAAEYNDIFLDGIPEESRTYNAFVGGKLKESEYPTARQLVLKVDAQVLFIKNDPDGRWVNGTIGHVDELHQDHIKVETESGVHRVEFQKWEKMEYKVAKGDNDTDEIKGETVGTFRQLPVRLGWAITIHKSQGLTFDNLYIDTGRGVFASGQLYVALSRCRTFDGIMLKNEIRPQDMIVNTELAKFNKRLIELNNGEIKEI